MGKCLAKESSLVVERIPIEEYINYLQKRKSIPRSTVATLDDINKISEAHKVSKATIANNLIEISELLNILAEACDENSIKIYADYFRYSESRKLCYGNDLYKDAVTSQISLLNKNLKRLPHKFTSKYLITQSIYEKSLNYYA